MKLAGSYKLNVKKEIVWKAVNNTEVLKKCIPGCEDFSKVNEKTFNVTASNQIGPMNATFSGTIALSNIKVNESYTLSGEANSSVGFANGSADVKIFEENGKTTLNYEVNVQIGGKIAQLGSRLINGVGKKMSDYFFGRFADLVSPIKKEKNNEELIEEKTPRVKELKSNFLNKYIYSSIAVLVLLLVVIYYFVSR